MKSNLIDTIDALTSISLSNKDFLGKGGSAEVYY